MTTVTDTDLSWATFLGEEGGESCSYRHCTAQATHVGIFGTPSGCPHSRCPYCLAHRDLILRGAREKEGLFHCGMCGPGILVLLLRMERLA